MEEVDSELNWSADGEVLGTNSLVEEAGSVLESATEGGLVGI